MVEAPKPDGSSGGASEGSAGDASEGAAAAPSSNAAGVAGGKFVPNDQWLSAVKNELPLNTILRLLQVCA